MVWKWVWPLARAKLPRAVFEPHKREYEPTCGCVGEPGRLTTTLLNPHSSHKVTSGPGIYQGVMQTAESKLHSHWWWEGLTIPNAWGAGSTQRCSRKAHYPPPKAAGEASVPRAQVSGARLSQDAVKLDFSAVSVVGGGRESPLGSFQATSSSSGPSGTHRLGSSGTVRQRLCLSGHEWCYRACNSASIHTLHEKQEDKQVHGPAAIEHRLRQAFCAGILALN